MFQNRPHIVLITADELHKEALSCYGNTAIETPNIDGLAKNGHQFHAAYTTSPWCLPARASLLTGRWPSSTGAFTNYREWDGRLAPDLPNLYTRLANQGYHTAHIGKCHYAPIPLNSRRPGEVRSYDRHRQYYQKLGIEDLILQDGKFICTWFADDYGVELDEAGYLEAYRAAINCDSNRYVFTFPGPTRWQPDSWVGRRANEYVASYSSSSPLFLWVSFDGPHYPFDPPAEALDYVDMEALPPRRARSDEFEDENKIHYKSFHGCDDVRRVDANEVIEATKEFKESYWDELRRHYLANVAHIDDYIGHLISTVRDRLGPNTLIAFTADHGDMFGNHSLWGKHNCAYEDVLNVPLLIDYPDRDSVQSDSKEALISHPDLTATLLETGGGDSGFIQGKPIDGLRANGGREFIFAEGGGFAAVLNGRRKYVQLFQRDETYQELYDLESDPDEFQNVVTDSAYSSDLVELQTTLIDRYVNAAMPFSPRPPIDL